MIKNIILFKEERSKITVEAFHGECAGVEIINKKKAAAAFENVMVEYGPYPTRVTVRTDLNGFSYFLRDVNKKAPIYIEQYGVVITEEDDKRSYDEIVKEIEAVGGKSKLEDIEGNPETSFEKCIEGNRELKAPAWLGVSRDIRMFEIGTRDYCGEMWDTILPRTFSEGIKDPEVDENGIKFGFMTGRGIGIESNQVRRLEDGIYPILNATSKDNDIVYHTQYFVTNEFSPLDENHVEGTDMYVADAYGGGHMFTPEQQKIADEKIAEDNKKTEETVLYVKVTATNTSKFPAESYVYLPNPGAARWYMAVPEDGPHYHPETGFGSTKSDNVYLIATLNGKNCPSSEVSVVLQAGEKAEFVFKIPHKPIPRERAEALAKEDYNTRFEECKKFWQARYSHYAKIHVPEQRIDEMIKAGYGHIDVAYFGKEPDGAVVPCIGVYTGIGSESSSAIQFLDAVGNSKLAERAIEFFLEKEHEDGLIMNFNGYMLETGYILWTIGEHYRYTRDKAWAKRVEEKVIRACEYNVRWREKNLDESLRRKGYGMISGKVADPEDFFHSYMLNSGCCAGFFGAAELLKDINPEYSEKYLKIAQEQKENIIESFEETLITSPVFPMANGRWSPTFAPWTETAGAAAQYAEGRACYSHGTIMARDMTGPQYEFLHDIFDNHGVWGGFAEDYYAEYAGQKNVMFSQPYYSPHPRINLLRGHVKSFLSEFYNNFSGLADRTTYSFWEHYWHCSPHKLHEEGWFLQRCRWMLWIEDGAKLKLLAGIPRVWMEDGKYISYEDVKSRFGTISLKAESFVSKGVIKAKVHFVSNGEEPLPEKIYVRLPNPVEGVKAKSVNTGKYCEKCECVVLSDIKADCEFDIELKF